MGTTAKSWIQISQLSYDKLRDWCGIILGITAVVPKEQMLQALHWHFNQPFRPDQITELFEGWVFKNVGLDSHGQATVGDCWIYENSNIQIQFTDLRMHIGNGNIRVYHNPIILDRFICHCQDAGIDLIWRLK